MALATIYRRNVSSYFPENKGPRCNTTWVLGTQSYENGTVALVCSYMLQILFTSPLQGSNLRKFLLETKNQFKLINNFIHVTILSESSLFIEIQEEAE